MAYLDIAPMLQAMRVRPAEFTLDSSASRTYLRHTPSRHLFELTRSSAKVHARCDCALLSVSAAQTEELRAVISAWKVTYWAPLQAQILADKEAKKINARFKKHFDTGMLQRIANWFKAKPVAPAARRAEPINVQDIVKGTRQTEVV